MEPSERRDERGEGMWRVLIDYCTCKCRSSTNNHRQHPPAPYPTPEDAIFSQYGVTVAAGEVKHIWMKATTQKEEALLSQQRGGGD